MARFHFVLSWQELNQIHLTLVCQKSEVSQSDVLEEVSRRMGEVLHSTDTSTVFEFMPNIENNSVRDIELTSAHLMLIRYLIDERLRSPSLPDGEHPDNDILDTLLPVREKMHLWSTWPQVQHLVLTCKEQGVVPVF